MDPNVLKVQHMETKGQWFQYPMPQKELLHRSPEFMRTQKTTEGWISIVLRVHAEQCLTCQGVRLLGS